MKIRVLLAQLGPLGRLKGVGGSCDHWPVPLAILEGRIWYNLTFSSGLPGLLSLDICRDKSPKKGSDIQKVVQITRRCLTIKGGVCTLPCGILRTIAAIPTPTLLEGLIALQELCNGVGIAILEGGLESISLWRASNKIVASIVLLWPTGCHFSAFATQFCFVECGSTLQPSLLGCRAFAMP